MSIETRVGYAAINAIKELTEPYIEVHTIKGKYVGDPHYLIMHDQMKWYLIDQLPKGGYHDQNKECVQYSANRQIAEQR